MRWSKRSEEGFFITDEAGILRSPLLVEGVCLLFAPTRDVDRLMILDVWTLSEAEIVPELLR